MLYVLDHTITCIKTVDSLVSIADCMQHHKGWPFHIFASTLNLPSSNVVTPAILSHLPDVLSLYFPLTFS